MTLTNCFAAIVRPVHRAIERPQYGIRIFLMSSRSFKATARRCPRSDSTGSRSTISIVAALLGKWPDRIEHVGNAAGHAGSEIKSRLTEDDDPTTGHVFTTVIADAFDHGASRRCYARKNARLPYGRGKMPNRGSPRTEPRCRRSGFPRRRSCCSSVDRQ